MARTEALTSAVAELTAVVGEVAAEVNGNEDQAAIDAAASAIETAVTDLKALLPKPAPAAPVLSALSPTEGSVGTSMVLTGSGFTGATNVEFGEVASTFTVDSDTQITATAPSVPAGAAAVEVFGPGGTSTAATFTVV